MVTHVHGVQTNEDSDGSAKAWYLPNANNIPKGYAETGTFYDYFMKQYQRQWTPGMASFNYPNDQRATTLWYHDHTLGMTRLNVYAGPALMALAERADIIVYFSTAVGTSFRLLNLGPDEPFGGGEIGADFDPSDPDSTGQVMEFRVKSAPVGDPITPLQYLQLPAITSLGAASNTR